MINVFIVERSTRILASLEQVLTRADDFAVVGATTVAVEAVDKINQLRPAIAVDVVVVDVDQEEGLQTIERISKELLNPPLGIIATAIDDEDNALFRQARDAGAHLFLEKPCDAVDLLSAIKRARKMSTRFEPVVPHRATEAAEEPEVPGQLIAVFSGKGGVGKSTIATNLAIALGKKSQQKITLIDGSLQFGDVGYLCKIENTINVADLVDGQKNWAKGEIYGVLPKGPAGIKVLLAPSKPEQAELITTVKFTEILNEIRLDSDIVIADCSSWLSDVTLEILDAANTILLVTDLTANSLKDLTATARLLGSLDIDADRMALVINNNHSPSALSASGVESHFKRKTLAALPYDSKVAIDAVNKGIPLVIAEGKPSDLANSILNLADKVLAGITQGEELKTHEAKDENAPNLTVEDVRKKGFKLFGRS